MTVDGTQGVNSGVQTNVGMDFQKHCTIYLFLEKYSHLKDEKYFIILEHHEDIVFGYLNEADALTNIETYQAKKSTNKWSLADLFNIIKKIATSSQLILEDLHPKTDDFYQHNYFATNHSIELIRKDENGRTAVTINETNSKVKYTDLQQPLKDKISEGNSSVKFTDADKSHFETLRFEYIDLSRTSISQLEHLRGKFDTVFGDTISDHSAAISTFLVYLKKIESTFNQGGVALLVDKSKRIESNEINDLLSTLTTKNRAYEFWRSKRDLICTSLEISLANQTSFRLHYLNSFDQFKDLSSSEQNRIYRFVSDNSSLYEDYNADTECMKAFLNKFEKEMSTTLGEVQLKATLAAAYVEIKFTL